METWKRIFNNDLWGNAVLVQWGKCICAVSFSVIIHSHRLWMMLVERENFSGFGFVQHFHRKPDFISTNNIHEPSRHCSVRIQMSVYGPQWSSLEKVGSHTDPKDKTYWKNEWANENASLGQGVCVLIGSCDSCSLGYLWPERMWRFCSQIKSASFMPGS